MSISETHREDAQHMSVIQSAHVPVQDLFFVLKQMKKCRQSGERGHHVKPYIRCMATEECS